MDLVLGGLAILRLVFLMLVHFLELLPPAYESIANTEETLCVPSCCHVGCSKPRSTRSATLKSRSARAALIQYNWKLGLLVWHPDEPYYQAGALHFGVESGTNKSETRRCLQLP